jgi:Zn-dependent protease with chaperone function
MEWTSLAAGVGVAAISTVVLYAFAALRARAIVAAGGEQLGRDLLAAGRTVTFAAGGLGSLAGAIVFVPVHWQHIGAWPATLTVAAVLACVAGPEPISRRPIAAAIARARGLDVRAARSYRRAAVTAIMFGVVAWPLAPALAVTGSLAARAAILAPLYLVATPVLAGLLAPVRARVLGPADLPPLAQERLSALAAPAGVTVRGRMIRARARKSASAGQLGWLPGLRYVLVSDYLLDELAPAEADALLVHELAHARRRDGLVRDFLIGVIALPISLTVVAFVTGRAGIAEVLAFAALAVALVVTVWMREFAGRAELAADQLAAATLGPALMAAALRHARDLNAVGAPNSSAATARRLKRLEQLGTAARPETS